MSISRSDQAKIARELIEIDEMADRPEVTEKLYKVASVLLELSGYEDNGIAFDISEYLHEKDDQYKNKREDNGWKKKAYDSLMLQLNDEFKN